MRWCGAEKRLYAAAPVGRETGMREKAVYGVLSAEPGRGSDVGPNSPGRKQGTLAP
jgi:hypothetical protein